MKHLAYWLTLVLILLGLHCFALHKRIQYLEEEIISMHDERMRLVDGFGKLLDEANAKWINNQKGTK